MFQHVWANFDIDEEQVRRQFAEKLYLSVHCHRYVTTLPMRSIALNFVVIISARNLSYRNEINVTFYCGRNIT
jgi:hypothetical protein